MFVPWKVILVVKPSFFLQMVLSKMVRDLFFLVIKIPNPKVKSSTLGRFPGWFPFRTFLRLAHPRQSCSTAHRRRGAEAPRSEGGQGGSGKGGACRGTAAQTQGQLLFALPWGLLGFLVVFFPPPHPKDPCSRMFGRVGV